MKICNINRTSPIIYYKSYEIPWTDILLENQEAYLTRKYPEVDPSLIQQAIVADKRNAEKLVLGLKQGIITQINDNAIAAVANLDPFAKVSNKSEADLAYEAAIKRAKSINPKYWQWILRLQKEDPNVQFDEGLFHYIEGAGLTDADLKKLSLEEVAEASHKWHEEQFANQKTGGSYNLGPDSPGATSVGPFFWVPVDKVDAPIEGKKMQNCIGTYCIPSDATKIFSLRNKFNNPHVSMSLKKNTNNVWEISEIKGKQNRLAVSSYIPYILEFADKMIAKGAKIGMHSDLWSYPIDFDKYISAFNGQLGNRPDLLEKITSDEIFNNLVVTNGISNVNDSIIKRLTPDSILSLVRHNPGANWSWKPAEFITLAMKHRKLTEEQALELLKTGALPRSALMTLKSVYHPDEFIQELSKINAEDLNAAWANYHHAIDTFPGKHPIFGEIVAELIQKRAWRSELQPLCSKIPTRQAMQILAAVFADRTYLDKSLESALVGSLRDELTSSDFDTKYAILSTIPNSYVFAARRLRNSFGSSVSKTRSTSLIYCAVALFRAGYCIPTADTSLIPAMRC